MSTYETNIPGAPGYEQANLLARRAYDNAMARLQQRRSQSMLHYGYTRDAQGNLGVDPNNEYGAYQQMLRGENQQSHRLDRAQRASGWGGGGYLGAQMDELQHQQGGEQAQLGEAFTNELAGISQQEQEAAYGRDQALFQNEQEATQRAIANDQFNPANYDGIDVPYGEEQAPAPPAGQRAGGHGHLRDMPNIHQRNKTRLLRRAASRRGGRRR